MKTAAHQYEDKLLEFAYGELPSHEAEAVDAHVRACPRCADALSNIRSVRSTMAELPMDEAPAAGLASLLAYAEQQAARNLAATPAPWWRRVARARLVASLSSLAALVVVGVLAWRTTLENPRTPAAVALEIQEKREAPSEQLARAEAPLASQPAPPAPSVVPERKRDVADTKKAMPKGAMRANREPLPATGLEKQAEFVSPQTQEADSQGYGLASSPRDVLSPREGGNARAKDKVQTNEPAPASEVAQVPTEDEAPAATPQSVKSLELNQFPKTGKVARNVKERTDGAKAGSSVGAVSSSSDDNAGRGSANVEAARAAGLKKDVRAEVKFAVAALAEGAVGPERLEMLKRACDGYERLGEVELADPYCDQLLTEFPSSAPAGELAAKRGNMQRVTKPVTRPPAKKTQTRE